MSTLTEILTRVQRIETKLTRIALSLNLDKTALPTGSKPPQGGQSLCSNDAVLDLLSNCLDFMETRLQNETDIELYNRASTTFDDLISSGY